MMSVGFYLVLGFRASGSFQEAPCRNSGAAAEAVLVRVRGVPGWRKQALVLCLQPFCEGETVSNRVYVMTGL